MACCAGSFETTVGSSSFTDLDYADDAVLFTSDPDLWDTILRQFETKANTMGLNTSLGKTKLQNVAYGQPPLSVDISRELVEAVQSFTYLGSEMSSTSYATPNIPCRIGLAYSNVGKLDRVWNN